jgi:hypothetical protein
VTHGAGRNPRQLLHVEFGRWSTKILPCDSTEHGTQIWRMTSYRKRAVAVHSRPLDLANRVGAGKAEQVECWLAVFHRVRTNSESYRDQSSFGVSVNCGSLASAAIPPRSKTGARVVRRFSAAA